MAQGLFSDQDVGQPQAEARPVQPAPTAPSLATTVASGGLLSGLGSLAESLVSGAQAAKKQQLQDVENSSLSTYARKITSLNAAVQQGQMSQSDAQRQQRAMYNTMVANNPQLTDKLTEFSSKLMGSEGLGDTLSKGTAVDQQIQADTKAATAAGFIQPGMSPDQQQAALNSFRNQQHQLNQMEFYSKQLGIQQQQLSIQSSQESIAASRVQRANAAYDLQIKRNKQRLQQSLGDVATTYFDKTQGQIQQIQSDVQSGKMTQEQALAQLGQLSTNFNAITMQARAAAGGDFVDSLSKPINDALNAQKDFISGKISTEVLQAKLDQANIHSNLEIMRDPLAARIVTVSKAMGSNFNPQLLAATGPYMIDLLKRGLTPNATPGNVTPDDPLQASQTKTYFNTLREATKNLGNNDPRVTDPKETFAEVREHANTILHSVADFTSAQKQPSQMNNVIDYLASPEFLALQKMGAKFDSDALEGTKNAVQVNYNDKLIPAVRDEWNKNKTVLSVSPSAGGFPAMGNSGGFAATTQQDTNTAVRYVWTGNSIVFQPAPGMERNPQVIAKARDLQQKVAPLINKSVRMAAHLNGSDDYTKFFKQNEQVFFGDPTTTPGVPNGE